MDPRTLPLQGGDDVGVGVAVPVVGADAEQRDRRRDGRQEGRVGGGGAVVRDGQDLRPEAVTCPGAELRLALPFDVAGHQHASARPGDPQHRRGLVQLGARVAVRPSRWRMEHLDVEVADPCHVPARRCPDHDPARRRQRVDLASCRQLRR